MMLLTRYQKMMDGGMRGEVILVEEGEGVDQAVAEELRDGEEEGKIYHYSARIIIFAEIGNTILTKQLFPSLPIAGAAVAEAEEVEGGIITREEVVEVVIRREESHFF